MTRRCLLITLALTVFSTSSAQNLEFEVGTVKISNPDPVGPAGWIIPTAPGVRDGRFTARYATLKTLLAYAYDVSETQISGPGWLGKNHYDIVAKLPEGATKTEARVMLQKFLAERLNLTSHSATQEMNTLALEVAKGGLKLRKMEPDELAEMKIPGGASILYSGKLGIDMKKWADLLTRVIGDPVVDQTGLQGSYAGTIAFTADNREPTGFPDLRTALKEQAGLELVSRKNLPVKMIIVDQANEVPEEN